MRFEVKLRAFFSFSAVLIILICASSVYAQPNIFGHDPNDIDWTKTVTGQIKSSGGFCVGSYCITSSNIANIIAGGGGGGSVAIGWAENGNNIFNTNAGNVGIGTSSPALKLHVNSSNSQGYIAQFENQNGNVWIGATNAYAAFTTDRPSFYIGKPLLLKAPETGSHDLLNLQTGGNGVGDIASIVWRDSNGAEKARILQAGAGHTLRFISAGSIYFNTNVVGVTNANERMVITENGNVGIGTAGPSNRLAVNGDINISGRIYLPNEFFIASNPSELLIEKSGINTVHIAEHVRAYGIEAYGEGIKFPDGSVQTSAYECILAGTAPGYGNFAVNIPAGKCITRPCTIIFEDDYSTHTSIGIYKQRTADTASYWAASSGCAVGCGSAMGVNGDTNRVVLMKHDTDPSPIIYLADDQSGIETSPTQWTIGMGRNGQARVYVCG
ncbi:MAG: hypothetical protein QXD13_00045 [Candidatus Pacearchaeota archaeon]